MRAGRATTSSAASVENDDQSKASTATASNNNNGRGSNPFYHFFQRSNVSAQPFPPPPLPPPLPCSDLSRIFRSSLPRGDLPPPVPVPDAKGDMMTVGTWALAIDYGRMGTWILPPPWLLHVEEPNDLVPVRVGARGIVEGGIPPTPLTLLSKAPPKIAKPKKEVAKERGPSHLWDDSIWKDRPKMNDGKDFLDDGQLYRKALNKDWRRLMNEDRFFKFVDREDDHAQASHLKDEEVETVEDEMDEVKEALFDWAGPLLRMFDFYCLQGAASTNSNDTTAFSVSENCYHSMCVDLQFVDKKCSKAFLSRVFVQVNVEAEDENGTDAKGRAQQNMINEDRALMRFEFIEAIVRVAVQKYKEAAGGDVSDAVILLMKNHVDPFFCQREVDEPLSHHHHDSAEHAEVGIVNPTTIRMGFTSAAAAQEAAAVSLVQRRRQLAGRTSQTFFLDVSCLASLIRNAFPCLTYFCCCWSLFKPTAKRMENWKSVPRGGRRLSEESCEAAGHAL